MQNPYSQQPKTPAPSPIEHVRDIEESSLPNILYAIGGIIIFFGFIGGFIMGQSAGRFGFEIGVALAGWMGSFVSGIAFIGFGKIIELMVKICNRLTVMIINHEQLASRVEQQAQEQHTSIG